MSSERSLRLYIIREPASARESMRRLFVMKDWRRGFDGFGEGVVGGGEGEEWE